jgi:hypothetical protein
MTWIKRLLGLEKAPEEVALSEQFHAQLKEALLSQGDLLDAVNKMRRARERKFRNTLHGVTLG